MSNESLFQSVNYFSDLRSVNGISFTEREIDIIAGIISGKSAATISMYLDIAPKTVETHTRNIMLKLGCNSRESIISFIEQTGVFDNFYRHYLQLVLEHAFLIQLKKIGKLNQEKGIKCKIIFKGNIENKSNFFKNICEHLSCAGVIAEISKSLHPELQDQVSNTLIISFPNLSNNQCQNSTIDLGAQQSYYHLVFNILYHTINHHSFEIIRDEFQKQYDLSSRGLNPILRSQHVKLINKYFPKSKNLYIITCIILSIAIGIVYLTLTSNKFKLITLANQSTQPIRSDLIIPIPTAFLERPEIIKKMNERLKGNEGIQTIALTGIVGIGGAGKTTIARYFVKSISDASIVWELNAETKDTLINSFRSLAYILASTSELKKNLNFIQQVQNPETQEQLIINFVKVQLKAKSNWILIYDNLESLDSINHLFANNTTQWGNGKIIITTRNEHITETSYIKPENVIHIDELNAQEMLTLFSKILYDIEPNKLNYNIRDKVINFLKNIPPFPLDVSVAAYSIKNTHVTFEKYLKHINEYSKNYEIMQVKLLKESTSYNKTRYGIISSTVEKLNSINPNFKELFFFICLMDSQNIAHKLLEHYNNNKMVDDLIYSLRQNGLLLRESYSDFVKENKVISLHRSTQEVGAIFFINSLMAQEKEYLIENMIRAIDNFYQACIKNKDIDNIVLVIPHLNSLLSALNNMSISQEKKFKYEAQLHLILGNINFKWTKNLTLAKESFKIALEKDKSNNCFSPKILAILLKDLCSALLTMNLLEEAIFYCKKSVDLCKIFPGSELILADNLQTIGNYYRKYNDFNKAYKTFEEALETLTKIEPGSSKELKAEIYIQLSHLYLMQYLNKKEGKASEEYAKKALEILSSYELYYLQKKTPLPPHISCHVARHRWKYSEVLIWHNLNYDEAYHSLQEAEFIMLNKCPGDMHLKGRIFGVLGEVLLRKNNVLEADKKITEAINILNIALGTNSIWTYLVRRAEIKIRLNNFKEAYEDCLKVFKIGQVERTNFHDLRYLMAYYHGAFAKYKLKDYQQSITHFKDFLKGMDDFCKGFLEETTNKTLRKSEIFAVLPYNVETELEDVKTYLERSNVIFAAILGKEHPFVKEYIVKNIED